MQWLFPRLGRKKRIILGVTGASGAIFARRTLQILEADPRVEKIHLVISGSGLKLLRDELDLDISKSAQIPRRSPRTPPARPNTCGILTLAHPLPAVRIAVEGMVVIPCTTGCLAQIASGISDTLIERAADVCLKQGRRLILAVRDAPFNRIHLENMLRAQLAGAVIFPIIPTFYDRPRTLDDLVTQFCCRVLALLDLEQAEQFRWQGEGKRRKD